MSFDGQSFFNNNMFLPNDDILSSFLNSNNNDRTDNK
jgi:hypothetical protein